MAWGKLGLGVGAGVEVGELESGGWGEGWGELGLRELESRGLGSWIVTPTLHQLSLTPPFSKLPTPTPLHTFHVKSSLRQVC